MDHIEKSMEDLVEVINGICFRVSTCTEGSPAPAKYAGSAIHTSGKLSSHQSPPPPRGGGPPATAAGEWRYFMSKLKSTRAYIRTILQTP